jgi:hypothetical protein
MRSCPSEAKAVKMSHAWVAECSFGWLGADQTVEANAAWKPRATNAIPFPPEIVPWSPERHPFTGV